jgi:hypothetical protein
MIYTMDKVASAYKAAGDSAVGDSISKNLHPTEFVKNLGGPKVRELGSATKGLVSEVANGRAAGYAKAMGRKLLTVAKVAAAYEAALEELEKDATGADLVRRSLVPGIAKKFSPMVQRAMPTASAAEAGVTHFNEAAFRANRAALGHTPVPQVTPTPAPSLRAPVVPPSAPGGGRLIQPPVAAATPATTVAPKKSAKLIPLKVPAPAAGGVA